MEESERKRKRRERKKKERERLRDGRTWRAWRQGTVSAAEGNPAVKNATNAGRPAALQRANVFRSSAAMAH